MKHYQFIFTYEMLILGKTREVGVLLFIEANYLSQAMEKADTYVKENFQKHMTESSTIRFLNMRSKEEVE